MKKKNFKYILIFIFIVCLLIPISCINIFAYNYTNYYACTLSSNSTSIIISFNGFESFTYNNITYKQEDYPFMSYGITIKNSYVEFYIYDDEDGIDVETLTINNNDVFYIESYQIKFGTTNSSNTTYNTLNGYGSKINNNTYYNTSNISDVYINVNWSTNSSYNKYLTMSIGVPQSSISFDKTYNLSFYNNDILYDSITISGASASGYAPFEEISQIKYGNTIVYDNSVWSSGYNSTLRYNQNMTMPDVMQLNIDCENIVTFYVQLYYVYSEYSQTYNIGTFYNKSQEFNSIQVNGLTIGDNKFSSINTIYYNDIKVYENNNFINSYNQNLQYMYNDIDITSLNTACNNIIVFTKTHIQPTTDDDILYGVGNILTIIKDFANMLLLNKVTIYCCVAIPLLSFAVFIVVKLKNGNDGDNKIN